MSTTTPQAIRDRVRALIPQVDVVNLTGTRFRDSRSELDGDFRTWAEANPTGCFRRFQVRNVGHDEPPAVSNMSFETRRLELEILVAYPQTNRGGADNALDRDDLIDEDWHEIDLNIGLTSRGNFGSTFDCTPLGATVEIERGEVIDIMVIRATYEYQRALTATSGLVSGLGAGIGG